MTAQLHEPARAEDVPQPQTGSIGRIVIASLGSGLIAALILVLFVVPGAAEPVVLGATMLAFALGWAMLAVLSTRRTDQPQRWARVPAVALAAVGAGLVVTRPGDQVMSALGWVWPPAGLAMAVWMFRSVRRDLRSRTRAWIVQPICAVLAIAAVGGGTETVLDSMDHSLQAPAGQTYQVAGHRMFLHCTGTGSPTVVLSSGFGERSPSWAWITGQVARTTRVCVYDRPGLGWSEPAGRQDGVRVAADLHALLATAGVEGPYVLAGHSTGGIYGMIFAARYPAEVAGMVLLDSATPEQFTALPDYSTFFSVYRRASGVLPVLARFGVGRVTATVQFAGLPARARRQEQAFAASPRDYRGMNDEWSQLPAAFNQAAALTSLGAKPLFVLSAGSGQQRGWPAAQDALARLSTDSVHRTIRDAAHDSLLCDRRFAQASSAAIVEVVAAARIHRPLPH